MPIRNYLHHFIPPYMSTNFINGDSTRILFGSAARYLLIFHGIRIILIIGMLNKRRTCSFVSISPLLPYSRGSGILG